MSQLALSASVYAIRNPSTLPCLILLIARGNIGFPALGDGFNFYPEFFLELLNSVKDRLIIIFDGYELFSY